MGRLGFRVGVSASYSHFRRVRNFDFVYTAAVSVPLALLLLLLLYITFQSQLRYVRRSGSRSSDERRCKHFWYVNNFIMACSHDSVFAMSREGKICDGHRHCDGQG